MNETVQIEGAQTLIPYYFKPGPNATKSPKDFDRGKKRLTGAMYFLYNTSHRWYWSATDDIMVDNIAVDRMLALLEAQFDPLKDIVFKGHCFFNWKTYLQGGSGYIFSRKAVEIFLKDYALQWLAEIDYYDDMATPPLREFYNLTIKETACQFFFGNFFESWFSPEFLRVENCQDVIARTPSKTEECDFRIFPMKDFVGLHLITEKSYFTIIDAMRNLIRAKASDDLYYFFEGQLMRFCRGDRYVQDDFFEPGDKVLE